jgi:hypothetical protein
MAKDFYNLSTEPDMRQELHNTFDGIFPEIAKAQTIAYRKMRLDNNGKLIPCACVDVLTGEPDKDHFCPTCFGEGWIWDEILVDTYKVIIRSSVGLGTKQDLIAPGLTNIPIVSFYFRHNLPINVLKDESPDKVVELETDTAGKVIRPYKRQRIYRIGTAIDFRSDHGKIEYWKLDCFGEQTKFLNGPKG